eukprot:ANDGO_05761.mRNA.1 Synapsin
MSEESVKPKSLLVIESGSRNPQYCDWKSIFADCKVRIGETQYGLSVVVVTWPDISISSYGYRSVVVDVRPARRQDGIRTVKPDFLLIRSVSHALDGQDSRNLLYAFMHAGVPSVNSLESILMCLERPVVFGGLLKLQKKLGKSVFPVIEQTCYSSGGEMLINPGFPCVVKVGHVHAGYGKIKVDNSERFLDVRGIVMMHKDYVTAEPFVERDYDVRVQKIGTHYRVFKRTSLNWKGNTGNASVEELPVTERYKQWADECSRLFGGLDILAVDSIVSNDGQEYILEVNDTAIGLVHSCEQEDNGHIRDLVLRRMEEHFLTLCSYVGTKSKDQQSPSDSCEAAVFVDDTPTAIFKEKIADLEHSIRMKDAYIAKLERDNAVSQDHHRAQATPQERPKKGCCSLM